MKAKTSLFEVLLVIAGFVGLLMAMSLVGCAHLDRTLFTVSTNWTQQVLSVTNQVSETNVVTLTNTVGQIVTQTNIVTIPQIVLATNQTPHLEYQDKPAAVAAIQTAGSMAGAPWGIGGLLSAGLVGAYHVWKQIKNKKVVGALVQTVETAKEVLKTTPQGQNAAARLSSWMVGHQAAAGVIGEISKAVIDVADTHKAAADAQAIMTV